MVRTIRANRNNRGRGQLNYRSRGDNDASGGQGGGGAGGPFLLLATNDGSKLVLAAGQPNHLLITGLNPASGYVPTYYILGF